MSPAHASVMNRTPTSSGGGGGGGSGGTTNTADGAPTSIAGAAGGTFTRIFFDDFDIIAAAGAVINSSGVGQGAYSQWGAYANGTNDTEANNSGTNSGYNNSIIACSGSNMIMDLHLDTASGRDWGAAPYPKLNSALSGYSYGDATTLYGRVETRFYVPSPHQGWKTAWLRWAKAYDLHTASWPHDGETDFPEGNLDGTIGSNMHWMGATLPTQQDSVGTSLTYDTWHTFVDEWTPSDWRFSVDGVLKAHSTGAHVPNVPMRWIAQTETVLSTGGRPISGQHTLLYWDYCAIYTWAP